MREKDRRHKQKSSDGNTLATVLGAVGTALLVLVILMCVPITIPRLFGYQIYTVISGSMEPAIPTGSLVYTKGLAPESVVAGDVIAFYSETDTGAIITHRVVENRIVSGEFVTKGDANASEDLNTVKYDYLMGKVEITIPYVGTYLSIVATAAGKIATACLIAAALIFRLIAARLRKEE